MGSGRLVHPFPEQGVFQRPPSEQPEPSKAPVKRPTQTMGSMRVPWEELAGWIPGTEWDVSCGKNEVPVVVVLYYDPEGTWPVFGEPGGEFPSPPWIFPPGEPPEEP